MSKVLIGYASRTGNTRQMAELIAEGVRFTGQEAVVRSINEIRDEKALAGYDAYLFGSPTYHRDMIGGVKQFLFLVEKANLVGKMGGAFCSYTHSGEAGPMIFDTMLHVFKMDMLDLGPLNLKEEVLKTSEGIKACQQYGRALGEKLAR
jgi:flavodoxin I